MVHCISKNIPKRSIRRRLIRVVGLMGAFLLVHLTGHADPGREEQVRFDIKAFEISGNTIFGDEVLLPLLAEFIGPAKASGDVETARVRIEK